MVRLSFELTASSVGSWNEKWSGADRKYFAIRQFGNYYFKNIKHFEKLGKLGRPERFYYTWDDGWETEIIVEIVDALEARRRKKISSGFCGYDWMVDSIISHGRIMTRAEIARQTGKDIR